MATATAGGASSLGAAAPESRQAAIASGVPHGLPPASCALNTLRRSGMPSASLGQAKGGTPRACQGAALGTGRHAGSHP